MSQQDCLELLQEEKKVNPERWLTVKDIQDGLRQKGKGNGTIKGVPNDLMVLSCCNDVEFRGIGFWKHHKEFRAH